MTRTTMIAGDWHYTKTHWAGTFTALNIVTRETHDTGAITFPQACAAIDRLVATKPAPAAVYTIESGPQRARAGHQRFVGNHHFE